jgi:MEDS: MEthanogen/methylotroph, DcmR Sensory domain
VTTVEAISEDEACCEHLVKFYEDDAELIDTVAPYLREGLSEGSAVIVIATEAHRGDLEAALRDEGVDLASARADGRFVSVDAAGTLEACLADGQLDREAFDEIVGGHVRAAAQRGLGVRAYGEMVALLWDAGEVPMAIELEQLWNGLLGELSFALFCAYPAASVGAVEHAEAFHRVRHLHSDVLDTDPVSGRGSAGWCWSSGSLSGTAKAPGHARRLAVDELQARGCGPSVVDDAALVVTELATNAFLHAGSDFTVTIRGVDSMLHISVRDSGTVIPTLSPRPMHGLALIGAVCEHSGVEPVPGGKVVWAVLPATS